MGVGVAAVSGDVDLVEQGVQELFAVAVGGGGRVPHRREVVAEGQDRRFLLWCQGFRACCFAVGEFGLGVGEVPQRGLPRVLQPAGDEPVLRVDRPVAAFGLDSRA